MRERPQLQPLEQLHVFPAAPTQNHAAGLGCRKGVLFRLAVRIPTSSPSTRSKTSAVALVSPALLILGAVPQVC